jgi:hypothetical protein
MWKKQFKKVTVLYFLVVVLVLLGTANVEAETFESYCLLNPTWDSRPGVFWEKIGTRDCTIQEIEIGNNSTKKVAMYNYRYDIWYKHPLVGFDPFDVKNQSEPLIVTAEVAVSGTIHDSWPFATHIMVGNAAIGIHGNKIAYGIVPAGTATRSFSTSFLTKVEESNIVSNQWYEVKIEYSQVEGINNDTASMYYRAKGSQDWLIAISSLATGYDLTEDPNIYFHGDVGDTNISYIDNINVRYPAQIPEFCGDENTLYHRGDINEDCEVDYEDVQLMADQWLN